jgi:hypothetical protein
MRRILQAPGVLAVAALFLLAAGCEKKPKPVDVSGKVVFAVPRPTAPLIVYLHPLDDANKSCTPTSQPIAEDGSFRLTKCLPGRYKATLAPVAIQIGANPPSAPGGVAAPGGPNVAGLPKMYFDEQTSPWDVTVPEGGKEALELTVSSH